MADDIVTANEMLLDRQIYDRDGVEVGKVDDIEVTIPGDGGTPVLTALLCGPTALGPRLGGRLGMWWTAIGRRLRPNDELYPVRIPAELVTRFDRHEVRLRAPAGELPTERLREWTREHIVRRIPGSH
ncbi:hypothetical protein HFP15_04160 [Amycolatopsis sp. K13G38]|uniref:PRC-barrel domain containing protein n=1 Tax=Amycolatopsis acididurans TaxID=2724524 RepID=A0ABX1J143_9PSEU|nr:hypothetical protein [Amycolatopsis acididurans]NKQ52070.1 hypothetical protein [Amycolatopsis acididurans]